MKKIMIGIAFVIIASLLAGCTPAIVCGINPDADNCTIEYTPITNDTIGDVTSADKLEVVDVANDFDFTITELGTFDYVLNQDIPYVDVEEFLYVLQEGLMYYTVTKDLTMQVTYTIPMGNIFNR